MLRKSITSYVFVIIAGGVSVALMMQFGRKHAGIVNDVAFSPDGTSVASAGDDGTVLIWDATTGLARNLPGKSTTIFSVAFSPDGKTLASESWNDENGVIELRDSVSGKIRATFGEHAYEFLSLRYSPDGRLMALGGVDVMIWDVAAGRPRFHLKGHKGTVESIAFSPDGKTLASGSYDRTIKLWDVDTGQERATLQGHTGHIGSVSFSSDGKLLASSSNVLDINTEMLKVNSEPPGEVKVWNVSTGLVKSEFLGTSKVSSVAFAPAGAQLAFGQSNGKIQMWDTAMSRFGETLRTHRPGVKSLAFAPDGKTLAAGCNDGNVRIVRVTNPRQ